MPPKKLTKAEKEKLKKEEAERKAAEEEARRLQEEEERRQREEEERKAQEERERFQAIEDARFAKETAALEVWLVHQKDCFDEWKAEQWKDIQWNRYLSCEKLPNPLSESGLNTYLQCWLQDADDVKDIETTFANISEALRLCEEIQCILDDKHLPSVTDKHRELLEEVVTRIRTIISAKVDKTTCCVLGEGSEKYLDSESNLKLEHKISKMAFCIWGNLSKNPRLKSFSFSEQDLSIEIPKPLQLADVAVRVVWPPLTQQLDKATIIDASNGDTLGQEGDDAVEQSSTAVEPVQNTENSDQPTETSVADGDAVESGSITASDKEASAVQVANEEEEDETNNDGEDNEEGSTAQSDKQQDDVAAAVEQPSGPVDELDLRAYVPAAGGLIMLELLRLPPQPKCISGWTIRQVTDDGVLSQPYPVDPNAVLGSATWTAFNISMKLPEGVMVNEDTKLAHWDQSARIWRTGGLDDIKIDTESQTVSCMAHHFTPVAIMLDRYTNMPYQTWEMKPLANDHTLYTITGATLEIAIEIKEQQCSLVSATANDSPVLPHLLKQWKTFSDLKKLLFSAGVNLFPEHDADNYVSIIKKDEQVEIEVYQQMSLLSCVVGFAWSKWSSEVNEQQFAVQACECVDQQTPWDLYIAGHRSCKLKMKDSNEQFSADVADNHEHHPDIFSTMDKVLTPAAKEQMKQTSACHVDCIRRWLVSTKPLTYS